MNGFDYNKKINKERTPSAKSRTKFLSKICKKTNNTFEGNFNSDKKNNLSNNKKCYTDKSFIGNPNSNKILSNILDSKKKFSVYSPSQLKQIKEEINILENDKWKQNILGKNNEIKNVNYLSSSLLAFIKEIQNINNKFLYLDINTKILNVSHYINNENAKIKLGSLIMLYLLMKKYFNNIDNSLKNDLLLQIINYLRDTYDTQEEFYLVSCLNIFTLYNSKYDILYKNLDLFAMFLTDFNFPHLQRASFICLLSLGYKGLETLIKIASQETYSDYQKYILYSLVKTPYIQKLVISKALLNEIRITDDASRRIESLSALNRLYDIIYNEKELLDEIALKLGDSKFKNSQLFIASILRCSGNYGLQLLINHLEKTENAITREIICKVLGYKLLKKPNYLDIVLDDDNIQSNCKIIPGRFCKYYGEIKPTLSYKNIFKEQIDEDDDLETFEQIPDEIFKNKINNNLNILKHDYLLVSSRDFLAALQRLIDYDYDFENMQIVNNFEKLNLLDKLDLDKSIYFNPIQINKVNNIQSKEIENLKKFKNLLKINENSDNFNENIYYPIEKATLKFLCIHLNDNDDRVRNSSAISLGQIGFPEGLNTVNHMVNLLKEETDTNTLSALLWAIGRNLEPCMVELIPLILKYCQNKMWKIKRSAIYCLSKFGKICCKQALPVLLKIFKETPINKNLLGEAIIKLGNEGEIKLLELGTSDSIKSINEDYKAISAITKSFSYIYMNSKNIDFIYQFICKQLNHLSPIVRKNAIYTLRTLSNRFTNKNNNKKFNNDENYNENINNDYIYLSEKNIIPIFYDKLKDKDQNIQKYAIECIMEYGPKGELIFIEGLIKDKSATVRCNCAIGLCKSGVHTLRTLITKGLYDPNIIVRKNIQYYIMQNFNIDEVVDYYQKHLKILLLKLLMEDYLQKGEDISLNFETYLKNIINKINYKINI